MLPELVGQEIDSCKNPRQVSFVLLLKFALNRFTILGLAVPSLPHLMVRLIGVTLAESRYLVSKKTDLRSKDDEELSDVFLFSSKSLMGPFESATLHHYQLDEENLHVLISKTNHESQLFINEQDMGKADDFVQLSDDGRSVYLRKYNALYNVNKRKCSMQQFLVSVQKNLPS